LLDVDDADLINVLLIGIAHKLKSLIVVPAAAGIAVDYSPRSVYTTLRPVIENLSSLENLEISLPGIESGINHCNHAHKLIQKTLSALPDKSKLQDLSISLPLFDCRSMAWNEGSDSEEEDPKTIDHAWFWMTLQNFVAECSNLTDFKFKGSQVPMEIERKLSACSPATMSFQKAEKGTQKFSSVIGSRHFAPPAPTAALLPLRPPPTIFPGRPMIPNTFGPRVSVASWRPNIEPYPEPLDFSAEFPIPETSTSFYPLSNNNYPPTIEEFMASTNERGSSIVYAPFMQNTFDPPEDPQIDNLEQMQEMQGDVSGDLQQEQEWEWLLKYD
jgi:hypothetical protein